MTTISYEGTVKSRLRLVMTEICKTAHEMRTDEEDMTEAELQLTLLFIENNLEDLEERVTDWVTDAIDNSL